MSVTTRSRTPDTIAPDALERALALRDLTDAAHGPHAMQRILDDIASALRDAWRCDAVVERAHPVVSILDNYDALNYPPGAAAREERYTRYVTADTLLRTHTSAMVPPLLRRLAGQDDRPDDVLLVCPGLVYRRDSIDRLHTGEPHQCDLWRVTRGRLDDDDLAHMIRTVVDAALPRAELRTIPAEHPYTENGWQVDVRVGGRWVEICECGLASPALLARCGLDPRVCTGLAMGAGLDRLLMLRKGMDDIRLLRADDPRIASQMLDLTPWRPVSNQPPTCRDLSVAVGTDVDAETIGDRVRDALGADAEALESVDVLSETPADELPEAAAARIGIRAGQKNVLLRLTIRHPSRTLTSAQGNTLRDRVYAAVHEGTAWQWAGEAGAAPAVQKRST